MPFTLLQDLPVLLLPVMLLVVVVGGVFEHVRRRRKAADLQRLLARDPGLTVTLAPCGFAPEGLATHFAATPRGERHYGIRYAVTGPVATSVGGRPVELEVAAFRWWWEVRQARRRSVRLHHTTVAAVRLPAAVPDHIVIRPESALGRAGLTRGGHQLESSEFNRHFRVEGRDRTLTVALLDARLQHLLTSTFPGRTVELAGEVLLLAGSPTHRDPTLTGVIGELPAVRQDAVQLVRMLPAAFLRAVGLTDRSEA